MLYCIVLDRIVLYAQSVASLGIKSHLTAFRHTGKGSAQALMDLLGTVAIVKISIAAKCVCVCVMCLQHVRSTGRPMAC